MFNETDVSCIHLPEMYESDIKLRIRDFVSVQAGELLVDELPICGHSARADLAWVSDTISGYEIKSQNDTLSRLSKQVDFYDRVFHYSTLVVAEKHVASAKRMLPEHWGFWVVPTNKLSEFVIEREPSTNEHKCGAAISEFLWTHELLEIISELGKVEVRESWSRKKLRQLLVSELDPTLLLQITAAKMKLRQRWRAA